jgi:peptidoglycan hydrolase-like protein with peptidoglycan-binding domain
VGHRAEPPDKVIADVQAVLQEMGYYTGEVDGLLGPLTREALTGYQADNGLTATAAIDQPTLDSLGMG